MLTSGSIVSCSWVTLPTHQRIFSDHIAMLKTPGSRGSVGGCSATGSPSSIRTGRSIACPTGGPRGRRIPRYPRSRRERATRYTLPSRPRHLRLPGKSLTHRLLSQSVLRDCVSQVLATTTNRTRSRKAMRSALNMPLLGHSGQRLPVDQYADWHSLGRSSGYRRREPPAGARREPARRRRRCR